LQQVRHLFLQIDLNRSFRAQQRGCAEEYCDPEKDPHTALNPRANRKSQVRFNFQDQLTVRDDPHFRNPDCPVISVSGTFRVNFGSLPELENRG
jgi:hypothetical protein